MIQYNKKAIQSGNLIEIIHYERPLIRMNGITIPKRNVKSFSIQAQDPEKNHRDSARRAAQKLERLIATNFEGTYKFVTLTFRDGCGLDITSVPACKGEFEKFRKRMNRYLKKTFKGMSFKYLGVIEFQDENRNGSVHFHLVTDMPYICNKNLRAIWGKGDTHISLHTNSSPLENQRISGYITKGIYDSRLEGVSKYLSSRNLLQPKDVIGNDEVEELQQKLKLTDEDLYRVESFESPYYGKIQKCFYYIDVSRRNEVLLS